MSPYLACSQTQRKGVVVGEEEIYICRAPCSFSRARFALIISCLQNREMLKVAYLRFTLLLKCLRSELEVDGGKQF